MDIVLSVLLDKKLYLYQHGKNVISKWLHEYQSIDFVCLVRFDRNCTVINMGKSAIGERLHEYHLKQL